MTDPSFNLPLFFNWNGYFCTAKVKQTFHTPTLVLRVLFIWQKNKSD